MEAGSLNPANASSLSEKLKEMIASDSLVYESWRLLILEIEAASPDDIDTISLAYEAFLSKFPLCHWHLEKYAYHKVKLSGATEAIKIFESGAVASMFSIGFWVSYITFGMTYFAEPEDVRRLFGRAISCVGRDYLCHILWDKYLKYEFDREGWSFLAQSYIESLRFPTKKMRFYYENFKQFVTNLEEETGYEISHNTEIEQVSVPSAAINTSRDEITLVVKDLLGSSDKLLKSKALVKYRAIGEKLYQDACGLDAKVKCFENNVRRRYFSATPLADDELNNWHQYLDFIEKQDDFDRAVKLYERCLIPCANYPEFWMRYVEFLQSKRGTELCVSVLDRATQIFLKNVPEIHLFNARVKETMGDANGASAALLHSETKYDSSFVQIVAQKANMQRRLGDLAAASATYEKALTIATEKRKLHMIPSLYSNFARFTFVTTGSADAARDVLIDGIRKVPNNKLLFEELITFAMTHEGANNLNIIDSVVAEAVSPGLDEYEGLNAKDRESVSHLFLQYVDLCGTVHEFGKAWSRHVKLFPQFLRLRPTYKHSNSANYGTDVVVMARKESILGVSDDPPKQLCSANHVSENRVGQETSHKELSVSEMKVDLPQNGISSEDKLGAVNVISESAKSKENELDRNLSCESRDDSLELSDANAQLANQSKEIGPSPHQSHESGILTKANEAAEAPRLGKIDAGKESNSQENASQELIPESDEYKTMRNGSVSNETLVLNTSNVNSNSLAGSKGIQASESPLYSEPSKRKHADTADPEHASSVELDNNIRMNQTSAEPSLSKRSCTQDQAPTAAPPETTTTGILPLPPSHPQQSMQQGALVNSPYPGQTQPNMDLSQMLQYYYNQQQFVQQQYQQQQQPYVQMQQQYATQQPYQLQQQQQQYYVQQPQQHMTSFQPTQQQLQQYGYPTAQGQQLLMQQYQQYQQVYQNYTHQQPPAQEGHLHAQEQNSLQLPAEKQQDGQFQQHHQGKHQKDSNRTADGASATHSQSPDLRVK